MTKKKLKVGKRKVLVSITASKITRTYGPFGRRVLLAVGVLKIIEQPEPKAGKRRKSPKYTVCKALPDGARFHNMRDHHFSEPLGSRVENVQGVVESLKDELDDWRSGMEGTGLEHTEKYSQLEEAVEQLEAAHDALEQEEVPEAIAAIPIVVLPTTRKRRCPYSRPNQQADALRELEAIQEATQDFCEDNDSTEEVQQEVQDFKSQIDDALSELDNVDMPGMY